MSFEIKERKEVEQKLVTIEVTLTYINGELQDQNESISKADIGLQIEQEDNAEDYAEDGLVESAV